MPRIRRDYGLEDDPLWYKDAIIYELHVRAFHDGDGDGVGDFQGLLEKLDYLQDLGVTAIWLLPFYPSPLKDDGYDISDYSGVHPNYGTPRDVELFVQEAHQRGIRVITELVLNHTSDQHPWFQRARRAAPGSRWRDFYVWSDTAERYSDARIIFKDFESSNWAWDPVAKAYYWHRFYTYQPDLNYDNPGVRRAILQTIDFWLRLGVDGLRLDAVPYLHEEENTSCENLPKTHAFLKELRRHVDEQFPNRMLLAEANQWPEDAIAYFGQGEECHMAFHFPLMPRLFMAIHMEDRFPIVEIMQQTPPIPESCQWALFLRNHDELTLEMVTDEDRDYMYRVYAQDPQARINLGIRRRLAPLLGNHRRRIELMNGLLFSLPGTPVIYYGDEIGMGDNVYQGDRNGVRTPMQWSADRNAGFSRANPQQLYLPVIIDPEYHHETVNVEAQQNNPHSLLWWMKRLIALRKRYKAFGQGTLEFLNPENRRVLAFLRRYEEECVLVVANLSRFVQGVELDLSEMKGLRPVEMFGRTELPPIGEAPYFLTLGPHSFYWFALEAKGAEMPVAATERQLPAVSVAGDWEGVFRGRAKAALEALLPDYLNTCRWFGGKARRIQSVKLLDHIPVGRSRKAASAHVTLVRVDYVQGEPETYVLPLASADAEQADQVLTDKRQAAIARLEIRGKGDGSVLYDALYEKEFREMILNSIGRRRDFKGEAGKLLAWPTGTFRRLRAPRDLPLDSSILRAEQSNTSVVYDDRFILKLFRRPGTAVNPDLEIGRFLTERRAFPHVPPVAGAIEYRRGRAQPMTVGILHGFVANEGNAWEYTLDNFGRYFERAAARQAAPEEEILPEKPLLTLVEEDIPPLAAELIGPYLESVKLLGQRTAELHVALAQDSDDSDFAPEPFSDFYRQSLYQSMRSLTAQNLQLLRKRLRDLPEATEERAREVVDSEAKILGRFQVVFKRPIAALRLRCHGDYHLGQVLFTGKDFIIIDFEGEPARPLSERRLKRSPLRDVAGMLRSFHYAAYASLFQQQAGGLAADLPSLETRARPWHIWVSVAFLQGYCATASEAAFLPKDRDDLQVLLDAFLLEKAVYEIGYELNNRPDWVGIPIAGILQLLETGE